jgi:ABC-2 type transport system ATP-binding protein
VSQIDDKTSAIKVTNLVKDYGETRAIDHLDLEIPMGEIFALVGPNGAGKTTLVKLILGIINPTEGKIQVFDHSIPKEQKKILKEIGYLAQKRALYESLTAQENIEFFAGIKAIEKPKIKDRTEELIKVLDLEEFADIQVKNLSGGTQQRVALACSCVNFPRLLVLDEATVGLDPVLRYEVWDYLRKYNQKNLGVIIITTHFLDEAEYADQVCFLRRGKMYALGAPSNLKKQTNSSTLEEVFLKLVRGE